MAEDERDRMGRRLRERLIKARKAKGLTQTDLARALGKSQSFVSNYERGERRLEVVEFILMCRVLKVEPGKIIGELERSR